ARACLIPSLGLLGKVRLPKPIHRFQALLVYGPTLLNACTAARGRDGSMGCHTHHRSGKAWIASQHARVLPVADPPTSTAIRLAPPAAAATTSLRSTS